MLFQKLFYFIHFFIPPKKKYNNNVKTMTVLILQFLK